MHNVELTGDGGFIAQRPVERHVMQSATILSIFGNALILAAHFSCFGKDIGDLQHRSRKRLTVSFRSNRYYIQDTLAWPHSIYKD